MFKMELQWKEHKISLQLLEGEMRKNPSYVGNQAHSVLELYFSEEPSEEQKEEILAFYDSMVEIDYKSKEQIESEKEAKKEAAMAKLQTLGLTLDELKALLG